MWNAYVPVLSTHLSMTLTIVPRGWEGGVSLLCTDASKAKADLGHVVTDLLPCRTKLYIADIHTRALGSPRPVARVALRVHGRLVSVSPRGYSIRVVKHPQRLASKRPVDALGKRTGPFGELHVSMPRDLLLPPRGHGHTRRRSCLCSLDSLFALGLPSRHLDRVKALVRAHQHLFSRMPNPSKLISRLCP